MPEKRKVIAGRTYHLRFSNPEAHLDEVIEEFVKLGGQVAVRSIQMPNGILLFEMDPADPASGRIWLYDRRNEAFHLLFLEDFERDELALTREDFEHVLTEYDLLRLAEYPSLLKPAPNAGTA